MRVVITGMGVISPIGSTINKFWDSLQNGSSGIRPITSFDTSDTHCKVGGQVQDFDPEQFFKRKQLKSMDRFSQLGLAAALMAWEDAFGKDPSDDLSSTGVIAGTGIGGIPSYKKAYDAIYGPEKKRVDAYTIPRIMNSAISSNIAIYLGLKGRNITLNTACSSGGNAIGHAFELIRNGAEKRILCGGAEAPVVHSLFKVWEALGVLSKKNDSTSCKPFDQERDGFALSEGAGMLVLESLDSALERNATIYAEITGFGTNCDASSLTSPSEEGVTTAMDLALKSAEISPEEIDYINAHGTGTKINDAIESKAIRNVFGKHVENLPVSSSKSMLGHSMGASSALELIITALTVKNDCIPPTINYNTPDPNCDLNYVPNKAVSKKVTTAMSNSFAFGGSNAVLVVKKWN
ncbi:MAG: 3-oxoacyl-[acyl-carrier-protein] synthase II [bacterium]|jgi:3-oxoacyl-[acyl-carrier-protein] synthase II